MRIQRQYYFYDHVYVLFARLNGNCGAAYAAGAEETVCDVICNGGLNVVLIHDLELRSKRKIILDLCSIFCEK